MPPPKLGYTLPNIHSMKVGFTGVNMQEHFLEYLVPRLGGSVPDAFPFITRELAEPALDISYDEAGLLKLEQHIGRLLKEGFST